MVITSTVDMEVEDEGLLKFTQTLATLRSVVILHVRQGAREIDRQADTETERQSPLFYAKMSTALSATAVFILFYFI